MSFKKFFERFVTILTVSVDVIDLSFQLISIFEKLDCKFKRFFIVQLKIVELHLNTVYAPFYF